MLSTTERLTTALAAFDQFRTPTQIRRALNRGAGIHALRAATNPEDAHVQAAERLNAGGVDVMVVGDDCYPARLARTKTPPPVLFIWGNPALLTANGIGMCGSRNVSDRGLEAARVCGTEVADHGLVVISGYARGVDTETHLAALKSGGRTVIVLAEGIDGFRRKRTFENVPFDESHVAVVSQFPPSQKWSIGAAMTRNKVIAGLGHALVVIEAGANGGTLDAGLRALELGRPVLALEFATQDTPAGNEILFARGALRIRGRHHLSRILSEVELAGRAGDVRPEQLSLLA